MARAVYSRTAMPAIHEQDAAGLAAAYARGELSPVEATQALLARIAACEPKLNAMYRIDADGAASQARAAQARWRAGAAALASRRRAAHHQGERLYARRPGADRHARERGRAAAARGRAAGGPAARGRLRDPRQDHHARLRHALLRPLQPSRHHAQPVAPRAQHLGLQLGRRRRRGRGLRAAASGHRHRRLGAPAGDALRHLRAQAVARARAGAPALHGPRRRADDAHRQGRGADDERARAPRRARFHVPALSADRFLRGARAGRTPRR